jgi:hypothetical protein
MQWATMGRISRSVLTCTTLAMASCNKPTSGTQTVGAAPVATAAPAAKSEEEATQESIDNLLATMHAMSWSEAFGVSKGTMRDTTAEISAGAQLFAWWSARHMRWSDVFVPTDETTVGRVHKDSSEELGKRMCSVGSIIEIHAQKPRSGGHLADGLFTSDAGNLYEFVAAGDTGDLVADSRTTLCGAVVGTFDYPNSAGGVGHAVALVGMFDLPENRLGPAERKR